jgi:mRNA interferase MazF
MRLGRSKRRGSLVKAPERGELISLTFTPQSGREQAGRRPSKCRCRMGRVQGVVLADQLRSLDWHSRQANVIGPAPIAVLERVLQLLGALLNSVQARGPRSLLSQSQNYPSGTKTGGHLQLKAPGAMWSGEGAEFRSCGIHKQILPFYGHKRIT